MTNTKKPDTTPKRKTRAPRKASDSLVWKCLIEADGILTRAADLIAKEINGTYSRQAVHSFINKSEKNKIRYEAIEEKLIDVAEIVISGAMRGKDKKIGLDAAKFLLRSKGRKRNWNDRIDVEHHGEIEINFAPGKSKFIQPKDKK